MLDGVFVSHAGSRAAPQRPPGRGGARTRMYIMPAVAQYHMCSSDKTLHCETLVHSSSWKHDAVSSHDIQGLSSWILFLVRRPQPSRFSDPRTPKLRGVSWGFLNSLDEESVKDLGQGSYFLQPWKRFAAFYASA